MHKLLSIPSESCHQKFGDFDVCVEVLTSVPAGAVQPCYFPCRLHDINSCNLSESPKSDNVNPLGSHSQATASA